MEERPAVLSDGAPAYLVSRSLLNARAEIALTIVLICNRRLFGQCYLGLQPDYFDNMPRDSGVLVCPTVPTSAVAPEAKRPGDIDLLVVPYEADELVLSRTIAIEIKVVRASFLRQNKSPNEFGFSQAAALSALGFPYIGLAHLIVSDASPPSNWRGMKAVQVLDQEGRTTTPFDLTADMMPLDLIQRTFGRLTSSTALPTLGLVAAYLDSDEFDEERRPLGPRSWTPQTRPAMRNPEVDVNLLNRVGRLYAQDCRRFMSIPRFDA